MFIKRADCAMPQSTTSRRGDTVSDDGGFLAL
jgi:hypothetical protein